MAITVLPLLYVVAILQSLGQLSTACHRNTREVKDLSDRLSCTESVVDQLVATGSACGQTTGRLENMSRLTDKKNID